MVLFCFFLIATSDTAEIYIIQLLSSSSSTNELNHDALNGNKKQDRHKNKDVAILDDNNKRLLKKEEEEIILNKLYAKKLSNNVYFPKLGLSCGTMDHKKIPFSVANMLLPYMDTANGSGGGIVYIDNTADATSDSTNIKTNNKDNEALISRAILYFIRERVKRKKNNNPNTQHNLRHHLHHPPHHRHTITPSKPTKTDIKQSALSSLMQYYNENLEIHIVLKISSNELGYNTTLQTVQNSLAELMPILSSSSDNANPAHEANVHVKIHVSLHLPRCNPTIPWLKCHKNKSNNNTTESNDDENFTNKWKESWKALHNLYNKHQNNNLKISSIGVSNFNTNDIRELVQYIEKQSLLMPHFYQGNINIALFDKDLVDILKTHDVSFIIYHTFSDILTTTPINKKEKGVMVNKNDTMDDEKSIELLKSIAYKHWEDDYDNAVKLANNKLSTAGDKKQPTKLILQNKDKKYTVAQLLLAWLTQREYIAINKAMTKEHIVENSLLSIREISNLPTDFDESIEKSVKSILSSSN